MRPGKPGCRVWKWLVAGLLLPGCLAAGCGGRAGMPGPQRIMLTGRDGEEVPAWFYPVAAGRTSKHPALLLVPDYRQDPAVWNAFAQKAVRRGILCLALQLRTNIEPVTRPDAEQVQAIQGDMEVGVRFLVKHGADPDNIAVAGGGLGANLALEYAALHPAICAAVLLSPGLDYYGVETKPFLPRMNMRPVLIMTAEGDSYAASSGRTLKSLARSFCELREYPGVVHGVDLLNGSIQPALQVLLWLSQIFPEDAAGHDETS